MTMPKRFLIIEDSPYTRQALKEMIRQVFPDAEIKLAGTGSEGLFHALDSRFDLILLDIELPQMDGFSILRMVMSKNPVPVLVVSKRNDQKSILKAMELGALDFLPKPTQTVGPEILSLSHELKKKIAELVEIKFNRPPGIFSLATLEEMRQRTLPEKLLPTEFAPPRKVIAIGASTGGPGTLVELLKEIELKPWAALILAQHLPEGYTRLFAEHLGQLLAYPVQEARNLDRLEGGKLYVLAGGVNTLLVKKRDVRFSMQPPQDPGKYVPSIDLLFSSLAAIYGRDTLGIICTGLGNDGSQGAYEILARGGLVMVEDPSTAVVGSMPRAVLERIRPHYISPMKEMAGIINAWIMGLWKPEPQQG